MYHFILFLLPVQDDRESIPSENSEGSAMETARERLWTLGDPNHQLESIFLQHRALMTRFHKWASRAPLSKETEFA